MCLFCFCDQALCVLLLSRDSALCLFPAFASVNHFLFYRHCVHLCISSVPHLTLICCLICFACALFIPLVAFTCVISLFPLLYIDLCFCSSLSDRNSLSVRIYARILHFSE